jgi:hypothetical protein
MNRMRCTIARFTPCAHKHKTQWPGGNYTVRPFVKVVAADAYSVEYLNSGIAFS